MSHCIYLFIFKYVNIWFSQSKNLCIHADCFFQALGFRIADSDSKTLAKGCAKRWPPTLGCSKQWRDSDTTPFLHPKQVSTMTWNVSLNTTLLSPLNTPDCFGSSFILMTSKHLKMLFLQCSDLCKALNHLTICTSHFLQSHFFCLPAETLGKRCAGLLTAFNHRYFFPTLTAYLENPESLKLVLFHLPPNSTWKLFQSKKNSSTTLRMSLCCVSLRSIVF